MVSCTIEQYVLQYAGKGVIEVKSTQGVEAKKCKKIGMIAGGTGITPLLAVFERPAHLEWIVVNFFLVLFWWEDYLVDLQVVNSVLALFFSFLLLSIRCSGPSSAILRTRLR